MYSMVNGISIAENIMRRILNQLCIMYMTIYFYYMYITFIVINEKCMNRYCGYHTFHTIINIIYYISVCLTNKKKKNFLLMNIGSK